MLFLGISVYFKTRDDMISMGMDQAEASANVAAYEIDGAVVEKFITAVRIPRNIRNILKCSEV